MKTKERLDILLVEKGYYETREKSKRAIMAGLVCVNGELKDKPSQLIEIDSKITIKEIPYVSRGGEKLEYAINCFRPSLKDKIAIDVGSSTGGFTECLLKYGIKKVYCVDVGYGQLHYKLRNNPKVEIFERLNIKYAKKEMFNPIPEISTIDVSFISLKKVLPVVYQILVESGEVIALVKPQFEADRKYNKKGIVKDREVHLLVLKDIIEFSKEINFGIIDVCVSPILGAKGNKEFFIFMKKNMKSKEVNIESKI